MKLSFFFLIPSLFFLQASLFATTPAQCLNAPLEIKNLASELPAEAYHYEKTRTLSEISGYFSRLSSQFTQALDDLTQNGGVYVDAGAGVGLAALEASRRKNIQVHAISFHNLLPLFIAHVENIPDQGYNKWKVKDLATSLGFPFDIQKDDKATALKALKNKMIELSQQSHFHYHSGQFTENLLRSQKFAGKVDLISSVVSDYSYSANRVQVIQAHLIALKEGGQSFITNFKTLKLGSTGNDRNILKFPTEEGALLEVRLEEHLQSVFPTVFLPTSDSYELTLLIKKPSEQLLRDVFDYLNRIQYVRSEIRTEYYKKRNVVHSVFEFQDSFYTLKPH